jgi:hypothetical protein
VEQGEKLGRVLLHSIGIFNFDVNIGRAEFGEVLVLKWGRGELLKGGILMLTLGGLHGRHAVLRGIWVPTQHLL